MARSNRQLTQFAVDALRELLDSDVSYDTRSAGNTKVRVAPYAIDEVRYSVELFGEEILAITLGGQNPLIDVYTGNFYDSKGRPSRTTRERLNGLLDFLSSRQLLPEGVRVFIRKDGLCCIGRKGADSYVFDESRPTKIISATPARVLGLEPLISPFLVKQIPDSIIAKGLV